ncbi:MAG: glutathione S-transferase family protein [Methanobacteriota archaeon]
MKARLFYLRPSHYCEKARAILSFKKIPFELVNVPYGDHQAVIKASGQDYVPFIEVAGEKGVLWPDVADWAEKAKPDPTIYPNGTRAEARVFENWAHQVVEEEVWKYVVSDMVKTFSDPQERWVFEEMQLRKRGPLEIMATRKPEFLGGVKHVCGLAEDRLASKAYLLGDKPSLADFALFGALHPLGLSGNEIPKEFGALRKWHQRVAKLSA